MPMYKGDSDGGPFVEVPDPNAVPPKFKVGERMQLTSKDETIRGRVIDVQWISGLWHYKIKLETDGDAWLTSRTS